MVSKLGVAEGPSVERIIRAVLAVIVIGALSFIGLAIAFVWTADYDMFDKFEVIAVESDFTTGKHAVSYWYEHANSSNRVFAIWILPNAPVIGSTSPVRNRRQPALVSIVHGEPRSVQWSNGHLTVTISKNVNVLTDVEACYFAYDQIHLVCINPNDVDVIVK